MFPVPLNREAGEAMSLLDNHEPSALHRLAIWSSVKGRIEQRSTAGWELDAARRLPRGAIRYRDAAHQRGRRV
jgi:hypothetical protein